MLIRVRAADLRRLAGLVVLLAAADAGALTVPALGPVLGTDDARARVAFDRAVVALKAKRMPEVDIAAREAYALGFGADAVELIAVAALQRTYVSLAHACYVALANDAEVPAGPRGRAQRQLAALDGQGGKVVLEGLPEGALVTLDGVSLGRAPLAGPVLAMAGAHALVVAVEGFPDQKRTLRFARGKSESVLAWVAPAPVSAAPAPTPEPSPMPTPAPAPTSERPPVGTFGPAPVPVAPPVLPGLEAAALQPFVGRPVRLETRFGPLPVVELLRVEAETAVLGPAEAPQRLPLSVLRRVEAAGAAGAVIHSATPEPDRVVAPRTAGRPPVSESEPADGLGPFGAWMVATQTALRTYFRHQYEPAALAVVQGRLSELKALPGLLRRMLFETPYAPGATWVRELVPDPSSLGALRDRLRAPGTDNDVRVANISLYSEHVRAVLDAASRRAEPGATGRGLVAALTPEGAPSTGEPIDGKETLETALERLARLDLQAMDPTAAAEARTALAAASRLVREAAALLPSLLREVRTLLARPEVLLSVDPALLEELRGFVASTGWAADELAFHELLERLEPLVARFEGLPGALPDWEPAAIDLADTRLTDFIRPSLDASYVYQRWVPADIPDVAYKTAGLNIARFDLAVTLGELPLVGRVGTRFRYETTPGSSADQARLVEVSRSRASGWEAYAGDLSLVMPFSRPTGLWHSLETRYRRQTFLVAAQALKDYWYYRDGGVELLVPGDAISTSTTMSTFEAGWRVQMTEDARPTWFAELGGFYLSYRKPYTHELFTRVDRTAVFDGAFDALGAEGVVGRDVHLLDTRAPIRLETRVKFGWADVSVDGLAAGDLLPAGGNVELLEVAVAGDAPLFESGWVRVGARFDATFRQFGDFIGESSRSDSVVNTRNLNEDLILGLAVRIGVGP